MSSNPAPENESLREALEKNEPRFFRAGKGSAMGKTGPEDTERFAENLMVLQECAILIGEKLEMHAVSFAMVYEGDETSGFCFDPNSNSQEPEVAGAIINQRQPMHEFVSSIRSFINL